MPKEKPKETLIGEVMSFYIHINVIAIQLSAPLKIGDKIHVKGATTDFTQKVDSMQIEHKEIDSAKKGEVIGMKVDEKVSEGADVSLMEE